MNADHPQALSQIEAEFRAWRQEHPQASLTELEGELDRRLRAARAQLLSDIADDIPAESACPDCGQPLVASGSRSRVLITHDNQPLKLTRAYRRCPACGTGLFPPR